ncbi:U6 snRNA phosphodiesterase [Phalaenopsis equestris]|uniref:U6 snRNA phosphodiesterase n=1 Tax=Phalaenopsis equestris TaxID=78828 RepID=UPI0009E649BF|nr:U6 snRNA phosphodiesterase [Phalaenopsis equestris]
MESLRASYGSDSESDGPPRASENTRVAPRPTSNPKETIRLPPPPVELLQPQNSLDFTSCQGNRVRSFPHVQGNYALHIFIPVRIPCMARKQLASYMKIISSLVPDLYVIDVDIALNELCKDDEKFEQIILGREFHISLGRPVPIKVHQIDSILAMLRQRLQFQRGYWMEFNKWEVFVNDELTRSFLSLEVTGGGLLEITRQICIVDEIYRLHGLPEFYKNPRPHISLVWALGDVTNKLKPAAEELNKFSIRRSSCRSHVFSCKFSGIECRIGKKLYTICKLPD